MQSYYFPEFLENVVCNSLTDTTGCSFLQVAITELHSRAEYLPLVIWSRRNETGAQLFLFLWQITLIVFISI